MLKAYKEFGGKNKKPSIAIVESRAPFQPADSSEYALLAEHLRREGFHAEVVSPEQLEYHNGQLRRGDMVIDIVYRCVRVQEFLPPGRRRDRRGEPADADVLLGPELPGVRRHRHGGPAPGRAGRAPRP